jgi:hypothetical protein
VQELGGGTPTARTVDEADEDAGVGYEWSTRRPWWRYRRAKKRQESAEAGKDREEGKRRRSSPEVCEWECAESLQGWCRSEPGRGRPVSEALARSNRGGGARGTEEG